MRRPTPKSRSILRELADAVDRLGEARVVNLLREAMSSHEADRKGAAVNSKQKGSSRPLIRHEIITTTVEGLWRATSREEGLRYIEDAELSRRELEALARSVDVPVRKDMRVEDLEDLIVNMTVGGRLNSLAIRGTG